VLCCAAGIAYIKQLPRHASNAPAANRIAFISLSPSATLKFCL
jgi:hypothetical protein